MSGWRQAGVKPAALIGPPFPEGGQRLWSKFCDLQLTRRSGFSGPERLSFSDLHSWQIVTGSHLEAWEIRALFLIDQAFMASQAEAAKRRGA